MKLVRAKKGYRKVGDKYLLAKKCTKCGRWLVASTVNFHRSKDQKYGLQATCKECRKNEYRARNNPANTDPNITKVCTICGREFPATEEYFCKHKNGKYGLYSQCKECKVEHDRQYRQEHKDKLNERSRQYYQEHKDKRAEYNRQYRQEHKDKLNEYNRQYRQEHKDKLAEYHIQYHQEHKDKINERSRQWWKNNPDKVAEKNRQWRENNTDKMAEYNKRRNKKRRQARIDAIIAQKRAEYEAERASLVAEKTCKCCGRTLPASEFYANKQNKDHLGSYCKECHKKKGQENYYHNLETKGWA